MIIYIKYDKTLKTVQITNDFDESNQNSVCSFNPATFIENDKEIKFELAVNTSSFEIKNENNLI